MIPCPPTATMEYAHVYYLDVSRERCYIASFDDKPVEPARWVEDISSTQSALEFKPLEPELVPYECARASGVLSFWDDPAEDIYTFEDGQAA
jgi:hypothetical protein